MKTIIHVNQHKIKKNIVRIKDGKNEIIEPVITVKDYKNNRYANTVIIYDKNKNEVAKVIYNPLQPLSCGAGIS